MRPEPPDQAERRRVATDLDTTLFVEAGAGTGKTTALVGRIVALAERGVELRHIAAITFTEAAAAQLRERVRVALERAAVDAERPATARQRCATAAQQVDEAAMLTLHGFAQQLLAEHALDAGLPPEFEILDEFAEAELLDEAWPALLDELLESPALAEPMETALTLGLNLMRLEELARAMSAEYDRLRRPGALPSPPPADITALDRLVDDIGATASFAGWCTTPDALLEHLHDLQRLHERLRALPARRDRLRALADSRLRCRHGRQEHWDGRAGEVKEHLQQLDSRREAVLADAGRAALGPVLARLADWSAELAERRRREGRLSFHDLLVRAVDLLHERPDVRRLTGERWTHLLVDEFQDTDPLQVELALALTTEPGDAGPRPGRLFFVGDPKQSIYRFRRADILVYEHTRRRFGEGLVRLSTSFRTVPAAVEWVNAAFEPLLDGGSGQAPFQALRPVRPALARSGPAVRVLGGPMRETSADELRARESTAVARAVRAIRDEAWPVAEDGDRVRPVRFADIAVLLPTRTALPALERALDDAGVPYRVEASSLVYESDIVRELIALLRAVDDPTDGLAVVTALRGPGFACPDDALVAWVETGGQWDYRVREPHPTGPVADAMALLRELHELRRELDPAALLARVIHHSRWYTLALATPRPRDTWRRLRFLQEECRAFSETGGTLRELIHRLQRQAEESVRVTEQVLPDEDDDAVRILTIHAAKGLEFPVAVLAGLGVRPKPAGTDPLLWAADGSAHVRLGDALETDGYAPARHAERGLEAQERLRLLYVAATRARDHLVLALHHVPAKTGQPTSAEVLWERCARCPTTWAAWEPPPVGAAERPHSANAPNADAMAWQPSTVDPARWHADRRAALASRSAAAVVSATGLRGGTGHDGHDDDADDHPAATAADDGPEEAAYRAPFRRGGAGTSLGRAVHAVLQTVDVPEASRLAATARAQAHAEGMPERAREIEALARSALSAAPVREALAGGRWWRELPVAAAIGGGLLEGYVDLLAEAPDGTLTLLDYKTDRVDLHDAAEVAGRYRLQVGAYALALQRVLGRPVDRAAFLFLREGPALVEWVGDLDEAVAEATTQLERHFTAATG